MRWVAAALCAGLGLASVLAPIRARAADATTAAPTCVPPADYVTPAQTLPGFAAALAGQGPIAVLALGSGSTVGHVGARTGAALAARTPGASFPYRLADALRAAKPGRTVTLSVLGARGMTAEAMVPLLRQALAAHHYDLLLWQTGTVEAVRALPAAKLRAALNAGLQAAAARHVDTVLIDPQFSRFLQANIDVVPYEAVLRETAASAHVALFQRLALTRHWVEDGELDLERVPRDRRQATVAVLNRCLGQALAAFVLKGGA